jgi:hypothetical protein
MVSEKKNRRKWQTQLAEVPFAEIPVFCNHLFIEIFTVSLDLDAQCQTEQTASFLDVFLRVSLTEEIIILTLILIRVDLKKSIDIELICKSTIVSYVIRMTGRRIMTKCIAYVTSQ